MGKWVVARERDDDMKVSAIFAANHDPSLLPRNRPNYHFFSRLHRKLVPSKSSRSSVAFNNYELLASSLTNVAEIPRL